MKSYILRCWDYLPKLGWSCYIVQEKLPLSKNGSLIRYMNFVSPKVAFISINLLLGLPLSTIIIPGHVLQIITWIRWMSYRNEYLVLVGR